MPTTDSCLLCNWDRGLWVEVNVEGVGVGVGVEFVSGE